MQKCFTDTKVGQNNAQRTAPPGRIFQQRKMLWVKKFQAPMNLPGTLGRHSPKLELPCLLCQGFYPKDTVPAFCGSPDKTQNWDLH